MLATPRREDAIISCMSKLDSVVKVVVLLAGLTIIGENGCNLLQEVIHAPKGGGASLTYQASTNGEQASVTFTNLNKYTAYACVQGVVTSAAGAKAETAVVCTGDMKPHSSVHVLAPYKIGAVVAICHKQTAVGNVLDWSGCEFNVVDRTDAAK